MASGFEMRVGDAEREAAAAELREHYASGRLTLDELNERLDAAFDAKTRGDLNTVMRDLPSARPGWSAAGGRASSPAGGRPAGEPFGAADPAGARGLAGVLDPAGIPDRAGVPAGHGRAGRRGALARLSSHSSRSARCSCSAP